MSTLKAALTKDIKFGCIAGNRAGSKSIRVTLGRVHKGNQLGWENVTKGQAMTHGSGVARGWCRC